MHASEAVVRSNECFKDAPLARQVLQDAPLIKQILQASESCMRSNECIFGRAIKLVRIADPLEFVVKNAPQYFVKHLVPGSRGRRPDT